MRLLLAAASLLLASCYVYGTQPNNPGYNNQPSNGAYNGGSNNGSNGGAYNGTSSGGYNNAQPQPQPGYGTAGAQAYPNGGGGAYVTNPDGTTTGAYVGPDGISIQGMPGGASANWSCRAECNGAVQEVSCTQADACNAWCDSYNTPHAECRY